MNLPDIVIVLDTREVDVSQHPWPRYWPAGTRIVQAGLETGDVSLEGQEEEIAVERKSIPDFVGCLGGNRDRFIRELRRSRNLAAFCVIIEGSLTAVLTQAHRVQNFSVASVLGTVASWSRKYCPILFADTQQLAAELAFRFLTGPLREAEATLSKARGAAVRAARAVAKAEPEPDDASEVMFGAVEPF